MKEVKEKNRKTQFEKYGCFAFNTEKQRQTMLERYGVENCMKNESVKTKLQLNNIKKYGVRCTLEIPEVKEKAKQTCLERYGAENVFSDDSNLDCRAGFDKDHETIKKAHDTLRRKYGGLGAGSNDIKTRIFKTSLERYGTITYPFYLDAVNIHVSKGQQEVADVIKEKYPDLDVLINKRGLLTENRGLEIDIWIPSLRIGIEYNGEYWHDREGYENDIINDTVFSKERVKDILCSKNDIILIQVWESDYISNKNEVLDYILNVIKKVYGE